MKDTNKELDALWDKLLEYEIATHKEIELVVHINGYTKETLEAILYARTEYNSFDQLR